MSNPTTPFSWQMPTATDLVTDLPADFEVFGQAVATSMADLLGGTTGQILAKNSATDMDFVWITNDQGDITGVTASSPLTGGGTSGAITVGIQDALTTQKGAVQLSDSTSTTSSILAATPTAVKSAYDLADTANTTANAAIAKTTVTTAGDIIYRNATVPTRLAIGTANQVLRVNAGATAPEWATPASSSSGLTLTGQSTFSAQTSIVFNNVFSSTYQNYLIVARLTGTGAGLSWRLRASGTNATGSDYTYQSFTSEGTSNTSARGTAQPVFYGPALSSGDITTLTYRVYSPNEAAITGVLLESQAKTNTANNQFNINSGAHTLANAYDGFDFYCSSGTITGSIRVYGYQNS